MFSNLLMPRKNLQTQGIFYCSATIGCYDWSMGDVAKFPGLIRRGSTYSLRTCVPKKLIPSYGRREIVTALGTADPAEAVRRAKVKAAEFASAFADTSPAKAVEPLTVQQRKRLVEDYVSRRIADEPYNRRVLLKQARANEDRFWKGEVVPAPDDTHTFKGAPHSFWADVCQDGEMPLEDAFLYAVHYHHRKRLRDCLKQFDIGDCDTGGFMAVARKLAPHVSDDDCERLALDLLRGEIRALEAIAARDDARVREITDAGVAMPPAPAAGPRLSVVKDAWLAEKQKKDVRGKTLEAYDEAVTLFVEIVGDKPVGAYGKDDMRRFKDLLVKLPKHRNKKPETRNLDAHGAAEKAATRAP